MKEADDDSDIVNFYDVEGNKMKFFDPVTAATEVEATGTRVPKMPMIPANVALKVSKSPTTPWELHWHLCNYTEDRDPAVKTILKKAKIWAIVASWEGPRTEGSLVEYSLPPVTFPSVALQKQLKKRPNTTPGNTRELVLPPMCNQPNGFNAILPQQVATAVIASMAATQPTVASMSDIFS